MTNKEYVTQSLNGLNVSSDDIELILLKASLCGDDGVDVPACDKAVYNRMSVVLKGMAQNVSEGGYSVAWNMEAVKMYYNALCCELGKENVLVGRPKVRNRSAYW
jgi:hypothetical protein